MTNAAVFTFTNNDEFYLPRWYRYYSQFFADHDIFVFDHNTVDGSTDHLRATSDCNVEVIDYPFFGDLDWYRSIVQEKQRSLLEQYEVVIFAEPDEIIWTPEGLGTYTMQLENTHATCTGYDVIQMHGEPQLDRERPIFAQRRFWYAEPYYDKTLVSRVPVDWEIGFHHADNLDPLPDPDLLLIHLHRVDFLLARERHGMRRAQQWSQSAEEQGWAWHLRTRGSKFRRWFYLPTATGRGPVDRWRRRGLKAKRHQGAVEEIPVSIRDSLLVL